VQYSTRWRAVSASWLQVQLGLVTPRTLRLYRNCFSPMQPVRAWTRTELSAFRRFLWSARTFAVGSVSSGIAGESVMDWSPSRLRLVAFSRHLVFQFFRTRVFKVPSQDSKSSFSNHFKASVRAVSNGVWFLASRELVLFQRLPRTWRRIGALSERINCAIPVRSSRLWKSAALACSHRSIGGIYASVSSCRILVALNAPVTIRRALF